MKKLLLLFLIFILHESLFSQTNQRGVEITSEENHSVGTNYALVVGISSYAHIKQLLYADDDAYLFSDFLINQQICAKKNIYRLIDSAATQANFYRELNRLINKVQPNDRVFIYFAGHGDVETNIQSGFLLTYNCEANNYPATSIEITTLEKYLNAFVNKKVKVVLITDACRSGNLAGGLDGPSTTMLTIFKGFQNMVKILSCQPNQLSQEKKYQNGGHGVFTYHLINGLNGWADKNDDNKVSLRELDIYLEVVATETQQNQNPKLDGDPLFFIDEYKVDFKKSISNNNAEANNFLANNKRNNIDNIWNENPIYASFINQIRNKKLINPNGDNAYETMESIKNNKDLSALYDDMKLELSSFLEDEIQKWISRYLRGELPNSSKIRIELSDIVIQNLLYVEKIMGEENIRYHEITNKRKVIEAYKNNLEFGVKMDRKYIAIVEEVDSLYKNQAWIKNICGRLYSSIKDYSNAEKKYIESNKLAPTWVFPLSNLGYLYHKMNKYEQSEFYYKKAIGIDSNYVAGYSNLGSLYISQKRYEESQSNLKIALSLDSNANIVHYNFACLYAMMGDTKKSLNSLETALIKGYINFELIGTDELLNNIRKLEGFKSLIKKYKK